MKELKLQTKPIYIHNDDVSTIDITLIYPIIVCDEDIYNYRIAEAILRNRSGAFPNEKDFSVELNKHLIINYSVSSRILEKNLFLRFDLCLPKDGITPEYNLEKALAFFKECIVHPLLEGDSFATKAYEREREFFLTRNEDSHKNNVYSQSYDRFIDIIDPDGEVFIGHDAALNYIKSASPKRSYELYKEKVLESDSLTYVFGNFDEDTIDKLLKKYFPKKKKEIKVPIFYDHIFHPIKHEYIEESSKFNQTALYMLFDIKDFKEDEKEYLTLISNIMGQSENNLIFKNLRLKNNLVYSSSVIKYTYEGIFVVETYLKYDNKDKAISVIKETLEELKDKKNLEEYIARLLKGIEVDLLRIDDYKYGKLTTKIETDLQFRTLTNIYNSYKAMKIEVIIAFINRIDINTIYVLRGESND